MKKVRLSKEFRFEMGHALLNYDGLCKHIHGHSYKLIVTVIGEPITDKQDPKFGMVMDFKDLKAIVNKQVVSVLDHSLIVYSKAEGESLESVRKMYEKVYVFDFQPTCENLVIHIAETVKKDLPKHLSLYSVKLYETATSFAEWYAADNA